MGLDPLFLKTTKNRGFSKKGGVPPKLLEVVQKSKFRGLSKNRHPGGYPPGGGPSKSGFPKIDIRGGTPPGGVPPPNFWRLSKNRHPGGYPPRGYDSKFLSAYQNFDDQHPDDVPTNIIIWDVFRWWISLSGIDPPPIFVESYSKNCDFSQISMFYI